VSSGSVFRRIAGDQRRPLIILGVLLALNAGVYGAVVVPLSRSVATVEDRNREARRALQAARAEYEREASTLKGQEMMGKDLARFYGDVLPQSWSDARRMTYLRVQQIARESKLEFEQFKSEPKQEEGSELTRVNIEFVLRGAYDAVRSFIHTLDTSPEFVVIDDIGLAEEGAESGGVLVLTLQLSTYLRPAAP
jgi:Tfp pilus assembly protein PilO